MTKINYNGWSNRDTWLTNLNIMNTSEIYTSILESFNRKCAWQKIEPENKGRRALVLLFTIIKILSRKKKLKVPQFRN